MRGYDLHTHSEASFDCHTALDDFAARVRDRGLAGVAVTDHDTIEGALRLRDRAPDFDVIIGSEITLDTGCHLIGLFLECPVDRGTFEEVADAIRSQGGLVLMPHPFRPSTGILGRTDSAARWPAILSKIDMIEVFNAKSSWRENQRAMDLAYELGIPASAGSDAHRQMEIGQGFAELDEHVPCATSETLRFSRTRIHGIDLTAPEVDTTRTTREHFRHAALNVKALMPKRLWHGGKQVWENWCDRRDRDRPLSIRDYGEFSHDRGVETVASDKKQIRNSSYFTGHDIGR